MFRANRTMVSLAVALVALALATTLAGAEKVTLQLLWPTYSQEKVDYGHDIARMFEEENPDVNVELILTNSPGEKLSVLVAGGTPPDVAWYGAVWQAQYQNFVDLSPYIERDQAEVNPDDFFKPIWDSMKFRGKHQILANGAQITVMYYNKDMFNEAGLAYPEEDWTFDDMIKMGKRLTRDKSGDGVIDQWGVNLDYGYLTGLPSYAGYIGSKDWKTVSWNTPENRTLFHKMRDMWETYGASAPKSVRNKMGSPIKQFQQGKVAMMAGAMWGVGNYRGNVPFDWDIQVMPQLNVNGELKKGGAGLWSDEAAMVKGTKHPELAWKFIKWFGSQKIQEWAVANGHVFPSRRSAAFSDVILDPTEKPENMVAFAKTMEFAAPVLPHPIGVSEVYRPFAKLIGPALWSDTPEMSIEDALEQADRIGQQALEKWNQENGIK